MYINQKLNQRDNTDHILKKLEKVKKTLRILKYQKTPLWKRIQTWAMYAIPHFRYGALVYNSKRDEAYNKGKDAEEI